MISEVKVSFMTEEERQAYIKKHPIKKPLKHLRNGYRQKFPYEKANEARWGKRKI